MKTKNPFLSTFITCLGLILSSRAPAQTFTVLHHFSPTDPDTGNNSDGALPQSGLTVSGDTLYGTALARGSSGYGTVFALKTNGMSFTNLHNFAGYPSDGANPVGALILSGNTLYGAANNGGSLGHNVGTVFAINTDSTGFTNLHNFSGSDGADLAAGVISSGDTLYGTAEGGGNSGWGVVFKGGTNGGSFTTLHSFTGLSGIGTNTDGAEPFSAVVLSGNTLYGTTTQGGSAAAGAVFAVNTDSSAFTNLHSFAAGDYDSSNNFTNSDGVNPQDSLILAGNTLYGTTANGGAAGYGTVFSISTNGTGFKTLHYFTALSSQPGTNSDGANPYARLTLAGNILYGTAENGGSTGAGTVFALNTEGTGFTVLHSFTANSGSPPYGNSDGSHPQAGLVLSGNTLYGTAFQGGTNGNGTVFSISFPPPALQVARSGTNVILTWPTNSIGVILQSTTNLSPPAAWSIVSPASVVVNGQNTVTNLASGTWNFYRLTQ